MALMITIARNPYLPSLSLRRRSLPKASVKFNPQNVPEPEQGPSKLLSAEDVVAAQLKALQSRNTPWPNHGLHVLYGFCAGAGQMERSRYFGFSKDLYHFDHFEGEFQNRFPGLVDNTGFSILNTEYDERGYVIVEVTVDSDSDVTEKYQFLLSKREFGKYKDCLMTEQIVKL